MQFPFQHNFPQFPDTFYYLEYLPKNLLCFFGDFLVKSVALKQRISDDIDSVSIETYICVMTNSQGFEGAKLDGEYLNTIKTQ